jgi:hypothetical protein
VRLALVGILAVLAVGAFSGSAATSASPTSCASGWTCQDVGPATPVGSQVFAAGTWTVRGGGTDIWGRADTFHFAWQTLPADGAVSARVASQTDTDQNAKAGVMVRSSTSADAAYYAVLVTPQHGLVVQYRTAAGQSATNAGGRAATAPLYLRAVRSGDSFTAFTSTDGATWTKVSGSTKTVPGLFGPLEAGLAVTSHNPAEVSTAVFTGAQVAPDPLTGAPTVGSTATGTPSGATSGTVAPTTITSTTSTPSTPSTTGSSGSTGATGGSGSTGGSEPGSTGGSTGANGSPSGQVTVCGTALCVDGAIYSMYGSTIYNPGLQPYQSGLKDPAGTIALAQQAHLNTIRITDFLDVNGDPSTAPFDPTAWSEVDAMIAAAGAAGLHVDLGLADYRAMLWNRCVDPYTADWSQFISFVANRVNTVTHVVYKDDPTIAFVSVAGEPLPVGTHGYTASATGAPCSMTYSTSDLTAFYAATTSEWQQQGGSVLINSGGLGYLNESTAGIDWKSIFSLPSNAFCDIKTYGGMQAWAPTAAAYCQSIGKPVVVEEFGWQQDVGDAARAQLFTTMVAQLRALHVAGLAFWNLGYQLAPTSYEVNPSTPDTFAAVGQNAP